MKRTPLQPWLTGPNGRPLCLLKIPGFPGGGVKGETEISSIHREPRALAISSRGPMHSHGDQPPAAGALRFPRGGVFTGHPPLSSIFSNPGLG